MLANFFTPNDEDPSVQCLTSLPDETGEVPESHQAAVRVIRPGHKVTRMTFKNGDQTTMAVFID